MNVRRALRMHLLLQLPFHTLGIYQTHTQTTRAERDTLADFARGRTSLAEIGVLQVATARRFSSVMGPYGVYVANDSAGRVGFEFSLTVLERIAPPAA